MKRDVNGEVCLEETVARLWREGLSAGEISTRVGLDVVWVESIVTMLEDGEPER